MQVRVVLTIFAWNWLQYLLTFQVIVSLGGLPAQVILTEVIPL